MISSLEQKARLHRRLRWMTCLFVVGLFLSGATAIPLETELRWLHDGLRDAVPVDSVLLRWVGRVQGGLRETNAQFPFMAYGTDWLAFGHFVIALAFVWAWREPVRNRWLFDFGLISCALLIPYAFVMGEVRGIPWAWRLVDCSFGVFGAVPLAFCRYWALQAERMDRGAGARETQPG